MKQAKATRKEQKRAVDVLKEREAAHEAELAKAAARTAKVKALCQTLREELGEEGGEAAA